MMERKQLSETLDLAIQEAMSNTHTATIARVTAVGETTISCQPVINRVVNGESIRLPEFTEVPPLFMQGGDSYTAHPIAVGDYCLLIFTERCFDRWYEGQDFQAPSEFRMHDYSDGIAIVGVAPRSGALTIPSVTTQQGDVEHTGNMDRTGNTNTDGDATVTGNMDADTYSVGGAAGWSGSFATGDSRTVTVVNGIITQVA